MLNALPNIFNRYVCFFLGVFLTLLSLPIISFFNEIFLALGGERFEIQSMASYPYHHMARLYTKPGIGDQTFTFEVDGRIVWSSGDAMGGDLNEKIIWDETGHIVSLELAGKRVFSYNAIWKSEILKK